MTKLFLQSGKLMIGEFPEAPIKGEFELPYAKAMKKYYAVLESAKASAVEVVNRIDFEFALGNIPQDGQLYDLPKGWTVGIEETLESSAASLSDGTGYAKVTPTIIARLVPSENAQGEKPGSGWSKRNLNVQYVGGIVATGIPEPEQPEALAFLNEDDWTVPESGEKPGHDFIKYLKRNELDYYNQREEWNEDTPQWRMYNAIAAEYILIRNHFEKHFSVFPLSQADRDSQEELWKEAINLYSKRDHSADGRADMMKEFTITRNTKP